MTRAEGNAEPAFAIGSAFLSTTRAEPDFAIGSAFVFAPIVIIPLTAPAPLAHTAGMFLPITTRYRGCRRTGKQSGTIVAVERGRSLERLLLPGPSQSICKHSELFEWGYAGSGPAQLSLAILLDFTRDAGIAARLHQQFKCDYVAEWESSWQLPGSEIAGWIQAQGLAVDSLIDPR